jgi:multidrug efflux pump subunit AcrA (membrane-fusion protein)
MTMTKRIDFSTSLLAAAAACLLVTPASAGIKCWVNKDGVRECGNAVPPEYSQQEQETISKTGITTGKTERAKTPEELEQARKEAAAKADAEKQQQAQIEADRKLLDTYATEDDIVLVRDGQISELESRIKITEDHIGKLNKNLNDIVQQAAAMEKRGEKPGQNVELDIENVRKQIKEQEAFIVAKRAEQKDVKARFDSDLQRYREMKSRTGTGGESQVNNGTP